jgi:ATP-dependent DNA helicase RecG
MPYIESNTLELKEIVNTDFKKVIIAFANSCGGEIYVGVRKDGEIVGVQDAEAVMERISHMIHDGIKPDLTSYTAVARIIDQGKTLIKVTVFRGEKRPYHLTDKGLKPSGVYIRQGVTSAPASDEAIRDMLKESDGTTYDQARSVYQELTFAYADECFKQRKIGFDEINKRTLKLITPDGYYTNAALLLSDQCEHSIKCAVYHGSGQTNFQDRKEFSGSILRQIDEAFTYLSLNNHLRSTFQGLYRNDRSDYPDNALREALLNSIVHRDYDYSGSIIINIYTDRIEFISLGGLVKGLTLTDIMRGVSQSRNAIVAAIFYRLELIESYGTGIKKIMDSYLGQPVQPIFSPAPASFVVMLPNLNESALILRDSDMTDDEKVMLFFKKNRYVTRSDIERLLMSSSFPANKLLNKLIREEKIIRVGSARATKYKLKQND